MKPLFNGKLIPLTQEIFDRLYFYENTSEDLQALIDNYKKMEAINRARLLRESIRKEYKEMELVRNTKYYTENNEGVMLYHEYKEAIADMNKFSGKLSFENIASYLYDVSSYASICLFKCKETFCKTKVDTKDYFDLYKNK